MAFLEKALSLMTSVVNTMNSLPTEIQEAIESMVEQIPQKSLIQALHSLSYAYREATQKQTLEQGLTDLQRLAYLACRLPATYAALYAVFTHIQNILPHFRPQSMVDLGAGPGTASIVVRAFFESLNQILCIEGDPAFIELGKKLLNTSVQWQKQDLKDIYFHESFDLSVISYALGELSDTTLMTVLNHAFTKTAGLLVLVEPGTPRGYATLMRARDFLMEKGAICVAPCPHQKPCPMNNQTGKWCHFTTRLARSRLHRRLKEADLGFEDEPFSYLILMPQNIASLPQYDRIVEAPQQRSGHIRFTICSHEGKIEESVISRRDACFKLAKKAEWGDVLPNKE